MKTKTCPYCAEKIKLDVRRCPYCEERLEYDPTISSTSHSSIFRHKGFWGLVVFLLLACLIVFFVFSGIKPKSKMPTSTSQIVQTEVVDEEPVDQQPEIEEVSTPITILERKDIQYSEVTIDKIIFGEYMVDTIINSIAIHVSLQYPIGYRNGEVMRKIQKAIIGDHKSAQDYVLSLANVDPNESVESFSISISVVSLQNDILSYSIEAYFYDGGVHGESHKGWFSFDLTTGDLITNDNLFEHGYELFLTPLIITQLVKIFNVDSEEKLEARLLVGLDEILPPVSFLLNSDGITYLYDRYEIASYADGCIEVFIPYEALPPVIISDNSIIKRFINEPNTLDNEH